MTEADSPVFPHVHVPLEYRGGPRMAGALELAAPLALGQRGLIVAPPRCGASTVLRWMGGAIGAARPDAALHALLIDQSVDDRLDWAEELPAAQLHGTTTDDADPVLHADVHGVFQAAADASRSGIDAVVLVDSLSALARALAATTDAADGKVLDGGLPHAALREIRSLFGLARARATDAPGSLTILATVQVDTSQEMDDVVLHELVGTGNVEWRLDADAMQLGMFPPVDIIASGARHAELIIGDAEADRRALLRAAIDEQGVTPGLGMLLDRLDMDGPLALLDFAH